MKTKRKILLIGDISLNGLLRDEGLDLKSRFVKINELISPEDIVIANLESPVFNHTESYSNIHYKDISTTEDCLAKSLQLLKVDVLSLANNHILDFGKSGLKKTIDVLNSQEIYYNGSHVIDYENKTTAIKGEIAIGFAAFVHPSTNIILSETTNRKDINIFSLDSIKEEIAKFKKHNADIIIISLHWGNDYSNYFEPWQQRLAHEIIDLGADVLMGHHPHTIQPYEIYKGKPIFYSLGGLCFGDFYWEGKLRSLKRKTKLGMIAVINEKAEIIDIIPTKEHKGNFITIPNINIKKKLKRLLWLNNLKNRYFIVSIIIKLKESVFDRIYEYFFGYYRNPIEQVFTVKNFKKIKFIIRDFKRKK